MPLLYMEQLVSISVDSGNSVFEADDGILFERDPRTLLAYPSGKKGESYTIPDGVVIVGAYAFSGSQLKTISFSSSVTTLQQSAMRSAKITSIQIPDTIKSIGDECFDNCISLSEVTFEGCPETIGRSAFQYCRALQSVHFSEGMES